VERQEAGRGQEGERDQEQARVGATERDPAGGKRQRGADGRGEQNWEG
jgi:hypothetical protein